MRVNVIVLVYQKVKPGRAGDSFYCVYLSLETIKCEYTLVTWAFSYVYVFFFSLS